MKQYILSLGTLTLILAGMSRFNQYLPFDLHADFDRMLVFFSIQSVVIAGIFYLSQKYREHYGLIALGIVVLRLLTAIIFLVIMYVRGTGDAVGFAIQFMGLYLSYLVFELTVVLANLRRN